MPNKYAFSSKAEADILHILKFSFGIFGENQTLEYKKNLQYCLQLLADSPKLGRECPRLQKSYRRQEFQSHVIFYRKRKNDIFIVRILHKSMDYKNHL